MKLLHLFPTLELPISLQEVTVSGLSSDSRYAKQGDLFFALQGANGHGLDYMDGLRKTGIAAIFYEGEPGNVPSDIPAFKVADIHALMKEAAVMFYQAALKKTNIIGITGTEGKTSVAMFTAVALQKLGRSVGMIGTNGIGPLDNLKENTHTTPDFLALYRSIDEIVAVFETAESVDIVLEVTSHALDQGRVAGLSFAVSTFLNLARDHLDYHETVANYRAAKERLFNEYASTASVLNIDDVVGYDLFKALQAKGERTLYPFGEQACEHENDLRISKIDLHAQGLRFTLTHQGQSYAIESPLYGHFNAHNLVAMVGNLLALGIEMPRIIDLLPEITLVKGRMEAIFLDNGAVAVIDYAHKPNALLQVLKALKKHIPNGDLYCIFGCGGDRDRGKRPLMAEIAEAHADHVIVTNDNPRTENDLAISDEIFTGFKAPEKVQRILDRKLAIEHAVSVAKAGDIILIAGKGHEDYQIIGHTKHHFSDAEIVAAFITQDR